MTTFRHTGGFLAALGLLALPVLLAGCGFGTGNVQNTFRSPVGPLGGGQRIPWNGTGSSTGVNTPVLGGPGGPSTPPPDLTQPALPQKPLAFDPDTDRVFRQYNVVLSGEWANADTAAWVAQSLQLYQPLRSHRLDVVVGPDGNRRGLNGLWVTRGGSAVVYLYNPSSRTTAPHEIAHDQTLKVQPQEGRVLRSLMGTYSGDPAAFARGYSRSNDREFAADCVSYWARRVSGIDPSVRFQPPAEIARAIQPFLADGLRAR